RAGPRAHDGSQADPARRADRRRQSHARRRDRPASRVTARRRHHFPHHRASPRRDRPSLRPRARARGGPPPRGSLLRRARRRPARPGGLHGKKNGWRAAGEVSGYMMGPKRSEGRVTLLACEGVVAGYSAADEVLKGVDLTIERGEIVSIIGPNGAGKSTLLKVVAGILAPSRGTVRLGDRAIQGRPPREISALGVAFVPQEQNIFPTMSVRENLEIGGYVDPAGARRRIDAIFERFH